MENTADKLPAFDPAGLEHAVDSFGLRLVVLFGSWARRSPPPGPRSDVDIAVLGCDERAIFKCHSTLSRIFNSAELDVVRLEDADPLFRHEIMSEGVLLAGDPDLFCGYRAYAYRDFVDSADLRELEQVLYRKKMASLKRRIDAAS